MYLSFYELNKKPFQISVDPMFLWMGEKHKEALAMLRYGIIDNRGFIMLTGDVGTGKTTLINTLIESLGPDVIVANITNPGLKRVEFINHLSSAFGLGKTYREKGTFLLDFRDFLEKCYRNGKQVLLIIDEAQRIGQDMFEEIRLLSNIEHQDAKLLNIFFIGQDELNEVLERYENRALRQRMTLRYKLHPLSEKEIEQFIEHRLEVAGTWKKIFTPYAVQEIYRRTKGYPRLINILCDHAMLSGYVAGKKTIDAEIVKECSNELNLLKDTTQYRIPASKLGALFAVFKKTNQRPTKFPKSVSLYSVGIFLILLLFVFIFLPTKSGLSFYNFIGHQEKQENISVIAKSEKSTEYDSTTSQMTFKVKKENSDNIKTASVDKFINSEDIQNKISNTGGEPASIPSGDPIILFASSLDHPEYQPLNEPQSKDSVGPLADIESDISSSQQLSEAERHYNIAFKFDSNEISDDGFNRLDSTVEHMNIFPGINLTIKGHTDVSGPAAYNNVLSKFRADIVKNYLVAKGIDSTRIETIGMGAEEPIDDNDDYWGRMTNRRVEIEMNFN
jgi:general secretion pathway protein A